MNKRFRLPKAFAEKWLAALRSGEYKQSQGFLYNPDEDGFCCLGLACKLEYPLHYLKDNKGNYGAGVILKMDTELKFNLHKIPEEIKGTCQNKLVEELTTMNDDSDSFEEIANWIERNVEFYE